MSSSFEPRKMAWPQHPILFPICPFLAFRGKNGGASTKIAHLINDLMDRVYQLAMDFWHKGKEAGLILDVGFSLGYAMQMLCADPEKHRVAARPDLWVGEDFEVLAGIKSKTEPWTWRGPLGIQEVQVRPSVVHLPQSKAAGLEEFYEPADYH
jgi:hypothetical protein